MLKVHRQPGLTTAALLVSTIYLAAWTVAAEVTPDRLLNPG
jgi:hypothetical protein